MRGGAGGGGAPRANRSTLDFSTASKDLGAGGLSEWFDAFATTGNTDLL